MEEKKNIVPVHDFATKLLQPSLISRLKEYVRWKIGLGKIPDRAPISINLDLTTGCNFACGHCVDLKILNQPIKFKHEELLNSLDLMHRKGLKSVILIGGGEPTLYSKFEEVVYFLKERDVDIAVVTNGTGMEKINNIGHLLRKNDWVRLSLDSGIDKTFQTMHKPRIQITLEQICQDAYNVKKSHPDITIGFSFIVTWKGAYANDENMVENIDEIIPAAKLAREHKFDYFSIKPFLERSPENNAEMINIGYRQSFGEYQKTIKRVHETIEEAKKLETPYFKIRESSNLIALENGTMENYKNQPRNCHMTFFHGVLSPLGMFICPVYRAVDHASIGDKNAYSTEKNYQQTQKNMMRVIENFNASHECRNVTCLYNSANWLIEDLIKNPEKIDSLSPSKEAHDYFF